jgi:hypothetical protein
VKLPKRKSEMERLLETANDSLDALTRDWKKGKVLKTGLIVGGLAGLAAASAGVSSLRRRLEGATGS